MNAHLTPHAEEIFLQATPFESRAARLIQGVVQEIEVERVAQRGAVGNIVMGRITRVLPGMQAAFVEAGFSRTGFLHVADVWQARLQDGQKLEAPRPIERVLYEGQQLMVQVLKDPLGSKGARLSTQLSIAGRYLVYLPYSLRSDEAEPRIGISQRIADPEAREALKARLLALTSTDEQGSFIARTSAEDASDEALQHDMAYLRQRWAEILAASHQASAGTVLYKELSLLESELSKTLEQIQRELEFLSQHKTQYHFLTQIQREL